LEESNESSYKVNQRQWAALADRYQTDGMAGSSPQKLLLAIFARLHRDLISATAAITGNQIEAAHDSLVNAQELVYELRLALDPDAWPGANELKALYDYVLSLLIEANLTKSIETIHRCIDIVEPLEETWIEANRMLQDQGETMAAASGAAR
jgi:flagellar protein FliS